VIVNSYPAPFTRRVAVYVSKQYVPGTEAPFIVGADGRMVKILEAFENVEPAMISVTLLSWGFFRVRR
jgi:enterochelin esterase family protein